MEALIDDPDLLAAIAAVSEGSGDPTGNWIGGGRPRTRVDAGVGRYGIAAKAYARWSATHFAFYEALVAKDPLPAADRRHLLAVDLGCAGGARTVQLADHYGIVTGVDRSETCIAFAHRHNDGRDTVSFRRVDWPGQIGRVHRIFAVEFFEHFAPAVQREAIMVAIESLVPDGLLFVTMPNEPPGVPPHEGTLLDVAFDALLVSLPARVVERGWFDNSVPGDPCDESWTPVGPKRSHHFAVLAPA